MTHTDTFFENAREICASINRTQIERLASDLRVLRDAGGRLFFLGVGGSAANAGHAVNDFRKLCEIESYAPTDNVGELTARTNDEGFETVFEAFLRISQGRAEDAVFVFSVGGGDVERNVSVNLIRGVDEAKKRGMKVFGVVGREGGYAHTNGDNVIVVPAVDPDNITPHSEAFQAVIWHCLVSHPMLQTVSTKW